MPKVARYKGSTIFCEKIHYISVRGRLWGGPAKQLPCMSTYKQHYDIIEIIRNMALDSTCRRISQKKYLQHGHSISEVFTSLVLGQKCLKNIGLKHQIINLLRAALTLVHMYAGHLESKERLRIQPAQLFNFS